MELFRRSNFRNIAQNISNNKYGSFLEFYLYWFGHLLLFHCIFKHKKKVHRASVHAIHFVHIAMP